MSENDAQARPGQVTVAGWAVAIAATIVVLAAFEAMSQLHSLDTRDEITKLVTRGSAKDLGLSVDDAIGLMRWSLFVAGVAAAAAAILGVFVLRRNHAARIGLTVAAVPIVLTAPMVGSLPGMIVGVGAALLWSRPARDWFAGRPVSRGVTGRPPQQPQALAPPPDQFPPPRPDLSAPPAHQPPPTTSWGRPGAAGFPPPPPGHPAWGAAPNPPAGWPAGPPRRVRIACIVTWVFSAITAVGAIAMIVVIAANSDELVDRVTEDPAWDPAMDSSAIVPATISLVVVAILWCIAAAVLAVFAWRRHSWAWILLLISTGTAALLSLFAVLAFPGALLHVAVTAACFGLLLHRESRAWFAEPSRGAPPAPPGPQPPRPW